MEASACQPALHRFQEKLQPANGNEAVEATVQIGSRFAGADPDGHDGVKSERPRLRITQFMEIRPGDFIEFRLPFTKSIKLDEAKCAWLVRFYAIPT